MEKLTEDILHQVITPRPTNGHKGTFGKVLLIGGNQNYGGAIIMATLACVNAGAGLVSCACAKDNLTALHSVVPEAMFINFYDRIALTQAIRQNDVIVIGPGLGLDEQALTILKIVLTNYQPTQKLIIDGSALTLLANHLDLLAYLGKGPTILTPHQMEWQRLSGIKIENQDELAKTQTLAQQLKSWVVLKKHQTLIFHPDQTIAYLPIGGPFMATGGMGDTLTGILAAIIAQFKNQDLNTLVNAGVYLHSAVAQELATKNYVVLPTKLSQHLPLFMQKICAPS